MNIVSLLATAVGFLAIFLILSIISIICAKPGRNWAWIFYGAGAILTAISLLGTLSGGRTDSGLVLLESALFVGLLILFGILIKKKLSRGKPKQEAQVETKQQPATPSLNNKTSETKKEETVAESEDNIVNDAMSRQQEHYNSLVQEKGTDDIVSENELIQIFSTYFAPNKTFYTPGSVGTPVYFSAINAAKIELLQNCNLLTAATRWSAEHYKELVQNPPPGLGSMMICGLIFKTGEFAVVKDMVYCVDFSEAIPHCIALYLLLIAQKQPNDQRVQIIDAGTGTNRAPLTAAMNDLRILDPKWDFKIW